MTETTDDPASTEGHSALNCNFCRRRWRWTSPRRSGFEKVYLEYREPLLRYVRNQARGYDMSDGLIDYEGLVQEAFTSMFLRWDTLREPRAWLFTVARNMVLARLPFHQRHSDHHLTDGEWRRTRRELKGIAEETELFEQSTVEIWWSSQVPLPTTEQSVDTKRVVDFMKELPERQRAATYLHHVLGMTQAEIAELLGCRPATVGVHIHRGVDKIRDEFVRDVVPDPGHVVEDSARSSGCASPGMVVLIGVPALAGFLLSLAAGGTLLTSALYTVLATVGVPLVLFLLLLFAVLINERWGARELRNTKTEAHLSQDGRGPEGEYDDTLGVGARRIDTSTGPQPETIAGGSDTEEQVEGTAVEKQPDPPPPGSG